MVRKAKQKTRFNFLSLLPVSLHHLFLDSQQSRHFDSTVKDEQFSFPTLFVYNYL